MLVRKYVHKMLQAVHAATNRSLLMNNPNYRLEAVENGFAARDSAPVDREVVTRIITSYNKAKEVQATCPGHYQVSNEWLPLYEGYMGDIMTAMKAVDCDKVITIYRNFMRERCSIGLHGLPVDMFTHYFSGGISNRYRKLFLEDSLHRFDLWSRSVGKDVGIEALSAPEIGNPYGYFIDGRFIRSGADYHHYYATMIARLLRGVGNPTVLELGGGYGGMAYYLLRDTCDMTYLDFDLPENLALASFYLMHAFPDKQFALFGETELTADTLNQYDVVMMPNFEIDRVPDNSIDLAYNSYSLAEMDSGTIQNYIGRFNSITKTFIYHVNHTSNCLVSADDFCIDTAEFDLLYRAPALWNMARNYRMDEFEFLYKNRHTTVVPVAEQVP